MLPLKDAKLYKCSIFFTSMNKVRQILERNKRVEADKAWEISITRRLIIAGMTYVLVVLTLFFIGAPHPFTNALIPTLGFLLSTLTLKFAKVYWLKKVHNK